MDLLVLIPSFLRALATALTSPAFSTVRLTSMLADIAALGALLLELGEEGQAKLKALSDHITALVQSGAAPSPDDWAQLGKLHIEARKLIEGYLQEQLAAPPSRLHNDIGAAVVELVERHAELAGAEPHPPVA